MARPSPVPLTVVETQALSTRAKRIVFEGTVTIGSALPAAYLSIWFTDPQRTPGVRAGRSDKRSMTVRFWEPDQSHLTVDFVLHGSGPASTWAARTDEGARAWAEPTKGGYAVPPPGSFLVLVGDDTALPAIGAIVEALDPSIEVCTVLEVVDAADERPLSTVRDVDPIWLHRGDDASTTGQQALALIEDLDVPDDAYWWVAGERSAVLSMRDHLVESRGVGRDHYDINAHWRLTVTDPRRAEGATA